SYIIAKKYSITNRNELRNAAIVGVLTFVFVLITINSIKYVWGRERYRHMIAEGSFNRFSMWFIPHGPASGDDFMSFPSGHSANSAVMIWITLIPTFADSMKNKKNWLLLFAVVWMIMVTTSRVIIGAHFASDVTMGATISLIIFTVLKNKYIKNS
ncbi:MAG: phosphatase PAP2 family protein, partial [Clostridiaceae bacterium]|nr:phosphatase PAP2 family protein [Clostridiaceae bacterium]